MGGWIVAGVAVAAGLLLYEHVKPAPAPAGDGQTIVILPHPGQPTPAGQPVDHCTIGGVAWHQFADGTWHGGDANCGRQAPSGEYYACAQFIRFLPSGSPSPCLGSSETHPIGGCLINSSGYQACA